MSSWLDQRQQLGSILPFSNAFSKLVSPANVRCRVCTYPVIISMRHWHARFYWWNESNRIKRINHFQRFESARISLETYFQERIDRDRCDFSNLTVTTQNNEGNRQKSTSDDKNKYARTHGLSKAVPRNHLQDAHGPHSYDIACCRKPRNVRFSAEETFMTEHWPSNDGEPGVMYKHGELSVDHMQFAMKAENSNMSLSNR